MLTDRGQPLAVIRRIAVDDEAARLDALATAGIITRATEATPMPRPKWRPEAIRGESIAETVGHDRDESA